MSALRMPVKTSSIRYSTALAKSYDTVIVEDLNVRDMVRNHRLAKSISD